MEWSTLRLLVQVHRADAGILSLLEAASAAYPRVPTGSLVTTLV